MYVEVEENFQVYANSSQSSYENSHQSRSLVDCKVGSGSIQPQPINYYNPQ